MVSQFIYLVKYDWMILVYYMASKDDSEEIIRVLERLGCSDGNLTRAKRNLSGEMIDTGLTYTNNSQGVSVMVISESSSPEEFWNTLDHEKGHVVQHVAEAVGMDYRGEEIQYLSGEIAKRTHPIARCFIR